MSRLFSTDQALLILALIGVSIGNGRSCIEHEKEALLSIRSDIWSDWLAAWTEINCCSWAGITCDEITGHVVGLDLHYPYDFDYNIRHIPTKVNPSLPQLSHLKYLDLSMNNFDGAPITDSITSLHNLRYLNLSNANFNGTIPYELGNLNHLRYLDLDCELKGSLLTNELRWLSRIPHLQYLDLSGVNLGYSDWLSNINMLTSIAVLKLRSANLYEIPATLTQLNLSSLTVLDLSFNNFNSSIPSWLLNIKSLVDIRLSSSGFHGEIPNTLVSLNNLQHLELDMNNLGGTMPESLGNLSNLVYLDLSSNRIKGKIPKSLGNLSRLSYLDLSLNIINGEIPDEITDLRGLVHLLLSNNHLSGNIPQNISALVNLQFLDLSSNYLSGSIPPNLAAIFDLDLSFNNLSGKVPPGIDPWVLKCNPNLFLSLQVECYHHSPTPDMRDQEDEYDSKFLEIIWTVIGFAPGYTVGFWGFAAVVLMQHERRIAYFRLIDTVSDWIYKKAGMPLTWIYQIIG